MARYTAPRPACHPRPPPAQHIARMRRESDVEMKIDFNFNGLCRHSLNTSPDRLCGKPANLILRQLGLNLKADQTRIVITPITFDPRAIGIQNHDPAKARLKRLTLHFFCNLIAKNVFNIWPHLLFLEKIHFNDKFPIAFFFSRHMNPGQFFIFTRIRLENKAPAPLRLVIDSIRHRAGKQRSGQLNFPRKTDQTLEIIRRIKVQPGCVWNDNAHIFRHRPKRQKAHHHCRRQPLAKVAMCFFHFHQCSLVRNTSMSPCAPLISQKA